MACIEIERVKFFLFFVHLIAMRLPLKCLRVTNIFKIRNCVIACIFYFLKIQYLMTEITFILIFNIDSVFLERLRSVGIRIRLLSHRIPIDFRTTRKPMHAQYTRRSKKKKKNDSTWNQK